MQTDSLTAWHALPPDQAIERLSSNPAQRLTAVDAAQRLGNHGPNRLAEKPPRPAWLKFLDQFRDTLVLILPGAAVLAALKNMLAPTAVFSQLLA